MQRKNALPLIGRQPCRTRSCSWKGIIMKLPASTHAERMAGVRHELRFESLHRPGYGVVIPCDAAGKVDLDSLTDRLLNTYLGARAMIGHEYAYPLVQRVH